ncbi:transporter [Trypanosoma conorhini]|uniref:Transporter n=1 Tax=Trypanosoma conorhini TaxID=83891 RepID=A0A3R7LP47_9TRYP|nr:transporter [Trypanosoma conorhini]RNF00693.1 transporter [Trypanosoma conorhini]
MGNFFCWLIFSWAFYSLIYVAVPYVSSMGKVGTVYATEKPIPTDVASTLFTFYGVFQIVGSVLVGWLATSTTNEFAYVTCATVGGVFCGFSGLLPQLRRLCSAPLRHWLLHGGHVCRHAGPHCGAAARAKPRLLHGLRLPRRRRRRLLRPAHPGRAAAALPRQLHLRLRLHERLHDDGGGGLLRHDVARQERPPRERGGGGEARVSPPPPHAPPDTQRKRQTLRACVVPLRGACRQPAAESTPFTRRRRKRAPARTHV